MEFHDVSNWPRISASSTKGTRDKLVLIDPNMGDIYFLKFPMVREKRDYTPENWSEVLAFEIGTALGFKILKYDLAIYNGRIGCISKNMITPNDNESLVEGHSILSHHDPTYDPSDKKSYSRYTFEFVQNALKAYNAEFYIQEFIRTLIFDAIIGNSDRHQSNWGIIESINITEIETNKNNFVFLFKKHTKQRKILEFNVIKKAAPIYDSGCCLGREFSEEQIQQHLDIQSKFDKYIRNGVSELRIEETRKKPSHEELLRFIKKHEEWSPFIDNEIRNVLNVYNQKEIYELITNIDSNLPEQYREKYGLTYARKEFIFQVIDTRINNLKKI